MPYSYDLALSFAGEQRPIAKSLADRLEASGYRIFFDEYERAQLWGLELPVTLGEIYGKAARFCLIIVSSAYVQKKWTNHERRFAISRALQERLDYILPVKVDDSELPGIPDTISYIDLQTIDIDDLYRMLLQKLGPPSVDAVGNDVSAGERERVRELISACNRRAIFTRMDSEIRLDAMFSSISECLRQVQPIVPRIETPDLQYIGNQIIAALDELERFATRVRSERPHHFSPQSRDDVDAAKLRLIGLLLQMRHRAGVSIQLPTNLTSEFFFSAEEAAQPPAIFNR
jgi:hypothetical protein